MLLYNTLIYISLDGMRENLSQKFFNAMNLAGVNSLNKETTLINFKS